ncbi:hypothetical protein GW17_00043364 [Ensete ventricosum]|nr:hypothetical protein GW17_00043364 [Ensete ventricosum]
MRAHSGQPQSAVPAGGYPMRAAAPASDHPLQGAWLQPAAPLKGGLGCNRQPICRWPTAPAGGLAVAMPGCPLHLLLLLQKCSKNAEIVYPCTPDPDGEDEGGQASTSLAVSTRWISAAKLL